LIDHIYPVLFVMHISSGQFLLLGVTAAVDAVAVKPRGSSTIPDYFQTSYGLFAGIYFPAPINWPLK
jgi:hypothetical protein